MPKINQEEYEVLKGLDDKWKWIARDKIVREFPDVYQREPLKGNEIWFARHAGDYETIENGNLFQFIQWEDEEPYNIAELIREYEYSADHVSHVVNERVKALGNAWKESEEKEVKDLERLKRSIDKRIKTIESDDITFVGSEYYDEGYIDGMRDVLYCINQLDEPEVLSQEKVQIPWFVYKWIEHQKMFDFTIYDLLSLASKGKWATESMNKFINENAELFIKAWLAYPNIEVEEEQRYYLKIGNLYLAETLGDMTSDIVRMTRDKGVAYQFTDEKSIATHLDKFEGTEAVKVEELEE